MKLAWLILPILTACSTVPSRKALVDDTNGFRVVQVDGSAPGRRSSAYATVIPFVELTPGRHSFVVTPYSLVDRLLALPEGKKKESDSRIEIEGDVRAGVIYQFVRDTNGVRLRERRPNQAPEPTATLVTPAADAPGAPSAAVAHL